MANVLFVNANLYGHINPTLPVVQELVEKGQEVLYLCSKQFKEQVEKCGAIFIDYGEKVDRFLVTYKPTDHHPFYTLLEYMIHYDHVIIPILLDTIKEIKCDCVVYDSVLGAGYFLKHLLTIPVICSNSTFAMKQLPLPDHMLVPSYHPQLDEFYKYLHLECETWKITVPSVYDFFMNKGDLNLVYTSKEFNFNEAFDESYCFVGPSIKERTEEISFPYEEIENETVIYISLGTVNTDFNEFYKTCIKAFRDLDCKIVLSVGRKCDSSQLGEIPKNFIVRQFVPQLEVLKKAKIFISHAGFNSVSEALFYGVAMIAIPMVNDQYMNAKRLEQIKAGITLKMDEIDCETLKNTVIMMLEDSSYQKASEEMGKTFGNGKGYEKAASYIMQMKKE